jgi:hypothetical protein
MGNASLFQNFQADVRFAFRSLLKNPGFLAVVVLSLSLGIAANSTIFSVLDTLLYKPLPLPRARKPRRPLANTSGPSRIPQRPAHRRKCRLARPESRLRRHRPAPPE